MSGLRFVDPPGRRSHRSSPTPGLLALAGAILAVLFLMVLVGMLERGLGITLGDILASLPSRIEAKQTSSQDSTSVL